MFAMASTKLCCSELLSSSLLMSNTRSWVTPMIQFWFPSGTRKRTKRLVRSANASLCPVQALSAFAQVRPNFSGSFFCHFGGEVLTQYQFNATLKRVLSFLGLEACPIRAHSFRIGAATTASVLGIPLDQIKAMGRWRSV